MHIVGTPPTAAQENHTFPHHTLGTGEYYVFSRIRNEITIVRAGLTNPDKAPAEIDRTLRACYVDSRPVYIQLPPDMLTCDHHYRRSAIGPEHRWLLLWIFSGEGRRHRIRALWQGRRLSHAKPLVPPLLDAVDSTKLQPNAHETPRIALQSTKSGGQVSDVITHE